MAAAVVRRALLTACRTKLYGAQVSAAQVERVAPVRLASTTAAGGAGIGAPARDVAALVQQYEEDGFAIVRNAISPDLVAEMQDHVAMLKRRYAGIPTEHWHHLIMRNDAFWVRLVSDDRLLDLAQAFAPSFLGDGNIALFSSHYFLKEPKKGMAVLWHQDGSYWPLRPMNVLTMWLSCDHSTRENGCLRVVRGTHKGSLADLIPDKSVKNVLGSATHTDADIARLGWSDRIVDLELAPGDLSIHHPNIVHGSDANTSDKRRCGLTMRYMSPSTLCTKDDQPVMMMRGVPDPAVRNPYRSWPKYRPGYDLPFKGATEYNARRRIVEADEPYFARTDYDNMEREIRKGLEEFIDVLGGR